MEASLLDFLGQIPEPDRFDATKARDTGGKISDALPLSHVSLTAILSTVMIVPATSPGDATADVGQLTSDVNAVFTASSAPKYYEY